MPASDADKKPNKKALYRFLAVILIVFGLFFILPSQHEINQAGRAAGWIPRPAKIIHSDLRQYGGGRAHDIPRYTPGIRGVFLDTGREFKVYRVSFAEISHKSLAEEYVNRFAAGRTVEVYVSPEDPTKVVLIRDVSLTQMYLLEALGSFLIVIALYLLFKSGKTKE